MLGFNKHVPRLAQTLILAALMFCASAVYAQEPSLKQLKAEEKQLRAQVKALKEPMQIEKTKANIVKLRDELLKLNVKETK